MKTLTLLLSFVFVSCLISCQRNTKSEPKPTTPKATPILNFPSPKAPPPTPEPTPTQPEEQKTSVRLGQDRHPPIACNIQNYTEFIAKPGVHNCNLERAWLRFSRYLHAINLQGANLKDARLTGSDIRGSNLRFTKLEGADLRFANLRFTSLRGADLTGADLRFAKLENANFQSANLEGADLRFASFQVEDLEGVEIPGSENWKGVNFQEANLKDAKVTKRQAEHLTEQGLSGFVVID